MSAVDVILCIVSAIFPLVGLILFIVKKEKKFGIAALIGFGVEIVLGAKDFSDFVAATRLSRFRNAGPPTQAPSQAETSIKQWFSFLKPLPE